THLDRRGQGVHCPARERRTIRRPAPAEGCAAVHRRSLVGVAAERGVRTGHPDPDPSRGPGGEAGLRAGGACRGRCDYLKTHGLCLLIPAMLAFAVLADAQELENQTIKSIRFDGLSQVSEQQVRARIEVQPGQVYDPRAVARDIRRLHELGYFGNIEVDADAQPDGIVLTYRFQE